MIARESYKYIHYSGFVYKCRVEENVSSHGVIVKLVYRYLYNNDNCAEALAVYDKLSIVAWNHELFNTLDEALASM